jgi:hypothetical protein
MISVFSGQMEGCLAVATGREPSQEQWSATLRMLGTLVFHTYVVTREDTVRKDCIHKTNAS